MTMAETTPSERLGTSISVRDISVSFQTAQGTSAVALDGVNFEVAPCEFVCIVGASGSGKSTLLRILDGLLAPTRGEVTYGDDAHSSSTAVRQAMVFQNDNLLPWSTVIDNVAYGLRLQGMNKKRAIQIAEQQLNVVGLADAANLYPRQLSGGMRQRINIARALSVDPDVLLLDEPFAALDAQTREIMSTELLRIWSEKKKTVIFITHQIDEAVYLGDRVIVLTAHPGHVREVVEVPFPRPRSLSIKRTAAFGGVVDHIWKLIESEVRGSLSLPNDQPSTQQQSENE